MEVYFCGWGQCKHLFARFFNGGCWLWSARSQELPVTLSGYVKSVQLEAYLFQTLRSDSPGVKELFMVKREECYHSQLHSHGLMCPHLQWAVPIRMEKLRFWKGRGCLQRLLFMEVLPSAKVYYFLLLIIHQKGWIYYLSIPVVYFPTKSHVAPCLWLSLNFILGHISLVTYQWIRPWGPESCSCDLSGNHKIERF